MENAQSYHRRNTPYPAQLQPGLYESSNLPSTKNNNQELLRVRASRLLDLFPDELVIQNKTVSVIRKDFLSTYVETMPVNEIGEVALTAAGPFAALNIRAKNPGNELEIRSLPIGKAKRAKEVIDKLLQET